MIELSSSVQFVKGVGPRRAECLIDAGVLTLGDLLYYLPLRYERYADGRTMRELTSGLRTSVTGRIVEQRWHGSGRVPRFEMAIADDGGFCRVTWFHGRWMAGKFETGQLVRLTGKVGMYRGAPQFVSPRIEPVREDEAAEKVDIPPDYEDRLVPIYRAAGGLTSRQLLRVMEKAVPLGAPLLGEVFPGKFRDKRALMSIAEAIRQIHFPDDEDHVATARRRLIFEEFFLLETGIAIRRAHAMSTQRAFPMKFDGQLDKRIRRRFPFKLTGSQEKVIAEIAADLQRKIPTSRLLQGDVGSGKTVVALHAILMAVANGLQAAIMAPTEILAEQHYLAIDKYLHGSRVTHMLLTGGLTGKKRKEAMARISSGEVDVVVGTHALVQKDVQFANLGLVVVDEQHKFGVHQRATIKSKGVWPHYLVMTATPIPRTLSLTVFGDLETSTITEMPPGRQPIITRWVDRKNRAKAYEFVRKHLADGEQAFFVYPLVEESKAGELKSATEEAKYLAETELHEFTVGLLHGRMKQAEKDEIMARFHRRDIDVLVATVVIEVGIDVPNATIMVIEHADRFGLAQLHQLRGRIGRGTRKSYCLLFGDPKNNEAEKRLKILCETNDGFRIAEEDLRIRGPGEFFGTRQHGLPELRIGDIIADIELLQLARRDAFALVKSDPTLRKPAHQRLKAAVVSKYKGRLGLIDVG